MNFGSDNDTHLKAVYYTIWLKYTELPLTLLNNVQCRFILGPFSFWGLGDLKIKLQNEGNALFPCRQVPSPGGSPVVAVFVLRPCPQVPLLTAQLEHWCFVWSCLLQTGDIQPFTWAVCNIFKDHTSYINCKAKLFTESNAKFTYWGLFWCSVFLWWVVEFVCRTWSYRTVCTMFSWYGKSSGGTNLF